MVCLVGPSSRESTRATLARVRPLFLLVLIGLGLNLSALDPRAGARTPWHDHVVLGAHSLTEWAHALAAHQHDGEGGAEPTEVSPVPRGREATPERTSPRVLSIGRGAGSLGASVFDIDRLVLHDPNGPAELLGPRTAGSWRVPGIPALFPTPVPVPVLPPRSSS